MIRFIPFILLLSVQLFAGPGYKFTMEKSQPGGATQTEVMTSAEGKLRMDMKSTGAKRDVIFDAKSGEFFAIDHQQKKVMVMNEKSINDAGDAISGHMTQAQQAMSQAEKEMEKAMKNMTPEQRAMMEKMKQRLMENNQKYLNQSSQGKQPRVKPTLKDMGNERVGSYACKKIEVWEGGEKKQVLWVTDFKNVKGSAQAFETLRSMAGFFRKMVEKFSAFGGMVGNDQFYGYLDEIKGFPVKISHFKNGRLDYEQLFKSVEKVSLENDFFDPPQNYQRENPFKNLKGQR